MKDRYINIQEWMLDLGLKGNELIIYALIYGFSQDGESEYAGSLEYLCKWTNSTKAGVIKALKSLLDKDLIKKRKVVNKVYYATKFNDEVNKVESDGKQSLIEGKQSLMPGKQSLPNNTIYNNINNNNLNSSNNINAKKTKTFVPPSLEEIKTYISEKNYTVDAQVFYDYYEATEWHDKDGNKVKNWKGKIVSWNSRNKKQNSYCRNKNTQNPETVFVGKLLNDQELDTSGIPF